MRIFGFEATLDLPGRDNIWACFLIIFSAISLAQGLISTDFMFSYRKGDSAIPRQDDLRQIGPFALSTIRTRNDTLVRFTRSDGLKYEISLYELSIPPDAARELISRYDGWPIAYLLINTSNPLRQIWGARAESIELLSYEKSVSYYKIESSGKYSWFISFAACVLWLAISIVDLKRVRKQIIDGEQ